MTVDRSSTRNGSLGLGVASHGGPRARRARQDSTGDQPRGSAGISRDGARETAPTSQGALLGYQSAEPLGWPVAAYIRERFPVMVFAPALLLMTTAVVWAATDVSRSGVLTALGLSTALIFRFRLWDDLADRERDRVMHPGRVLVAAPTTPFRVSLAISAVLAVGLSAADRPALVALAGTHAACWCAYRLRRFLTPAVWPFVLVLKYPAFLTIASLALGARDWNRMVVAATTSYACAVAYEMWHDRLARRRVRSLNPKWEKPNEVRTMSDAVSPDVGRVLFSRRANQQHVTDLDRLRFEPVSCLACGSRQAVPFIEAEDDLTGKPGLFTFVTCSACALVYQAPRLTPANIREYYDQEYIAHQAPSRWGALAPLFRAAMRSLDRAKLRIVRRHTTLDASSRVLDVGCGSGSFLREAHARTGASVAGIDLVDLSKRPELAGVEFHHGLFYDQPVGRERFDLVTMWHFLEHDYDPRRSLLHARDALKPGGTLVVEVPRLDSLSFWIFGRRWPGLQAPQHTALYDRERLEQMVVASGFEIVEYLPYGAFPPYFYLFCGVAFALRRGRGLNLNRAIYAYFAGQLLALPLLPLLNRMNFAMQTVICRRPR